MELMSPTISALAASQSSALARSASVQIQPHAERNAFVQAARSSRDHFKQTGLHITLDEFATWVDTVQTNPQAQMPQCHV